MLFYSERTDCAQTTVCPKHTPHVYLYTIMCFPTKSGRKTLIIRPSIIRNLDYPAWKFSKKNNNKKSSLKTGVSAAVTMNTGMFIYCACADACCLSIKWVDQGVVYPIRLSGLFSYPAWLRNKGVRIIEVLLYNYRP